jgi:hypothetical protein
MSRHGRTALLVSLLTSLLAGCVSSTAPSASHDCGGIGAGTGQNC